MNTWNFNSVASDFTTHISEQLPWYPLFNNLVLVEVARYFIKPSSRVYDIGASIGNVELQTANILTERNVEFIPIDTNVMMAEFYKGDKNRLITHNAVNFKYKKFSFLTSILTLSFIHPSDRKSLLVNLKRKCIVGGAILILEKIENKNGALGNIQNRITWKAKLDNNVELKTIVNKEISLSGSQIPLNKNELKGFTKVWQFGDFCAFVYIKK